MKDTQDVYQSSFEFMSSVQAEPRWFEYFLFVNMYVVQRCPLFIFVFEASHSVYHNRINFWHLKEAKSKCQNLHSYVD